MEKDIANKEVNLGTMRSYMNEWYPNGIHEAVEKVDEIVFEDYDKTLTMTDAVSGELVFQAIFHQFEEVNDNSTVYLCGIMNKELRGIIAKCLELDEQNAAYLNSAANQKQ